jgi:hypothetical protein
MRSQCVFVVVSAMVIAAPGIGNAAQRSGKIDALGEIATNLGRVIGAASVCREMSWPRIKALTDKFSGLVKASVTNGEEFSSIQEAYDQSAVQGQRTVSSKQVDCVAAVRDLADLERVVTSQLPAAIGTGASSAQARTATTASPSLAPVTSGASPPPVGATTGAAPQQHSRQRRDR